MAECTINISLPSIQVLMTGPVKMQLITTPQTLYNHGNPAGNAPPHIVPCNLHISIITTECRDMDQAEVNADATRSSSHPTVKDEPRDREELVVKSVAVISAEDALGYGEANNLYASPHNFEPDYEEDMQLEHEDAEEDMAEEDDDATHVMHVADGCRSSRSTAPANFPNMMINGGLVEDTQAGASLISASYCGDGNHVQDVQSDSPLTDETDSNADLTAELPVDSGLYDFIEEEGIDAPILIIG